MDPEMVTITKAEYDGLVEAAMWADALDGAGVDNWGGFDTAVEIFEGFKKELSN